MIAEGDEKGFLIDDEDIYIGYRRPEVVKDTKFNNLDDDLSDDIKWKLFLARQIALMKYRETWG